MLQQIKRTGSRCLLLVPLGLIVLLFECVPLISTARPSSTACG